MSKKYIYINKKWLKQNFKKGSKTEKQDEIEKTNIRGEMGHNTTDTSRMKCKYH